MHEFTFPAIRNVEDMLECAMIAFVCSPKFSQILHQNIRIIPKRMNYNLLGAIVSPLNYEVEFL